MPVAWVALVVEVALLGLAAVAAVAAATTVVTKALLVVVVVLAFTGKGPAVAAALAAAVLAAAAAGLAVGKATLETMFAAAVVLLPLVMAVTEGITEEAVPPGTRGRVVEATGLSASYGPASHACSHLHKRHQFVPPLP